MLRGRRSTMRKHAEADVEGIDGASPIAMAVRTAAAASRPASSSKRAPNGRKQGEQGRRRPEPSRPPCRARRAPLPRRAGGRRRPRRAAMSVRCRRRPRSPSTNGRRSATPASASVRRRARGHVPTSIGTDHLRATATAGRRTANPASSRGSGWRRQRTVASPRQAHRRGEAVDEVAAALLEVPDRPSPDPGRPGLRSRRYGVEAEVDVAAVGTVRQWARSRPSRRWRRCVALEVEVGDERRSGRSPPCTSRPDCGRRSGSTDVVASSAASPVARRPSCADGPGRGRRRRRRRVAAEVPRRRADRGSGDDRRGRRRAGAARAGRGRGAGAGAGGRGAVAGRRAGAVAAGVAAAAGDGGAADAADGVAGERRRGDGARAARRRRRSRRPLVAGRPRSAPDARRAAPSATVCLGWASTDTGRPSAALTISATSGMRDEPPASTTALRSPAVTPAELDRPLQHRHRLARGPGGSSPRTRGG